MMRVRTAIAVALGVALVGVATLQADVKTQERSQMKFEGVLGRVVGLFGGKAAREGIVNTIAVKGDRKMESSETAE